MNQLGRNQAGWNEQQDPLGNTAARNATFGNDDSTVDSLHAPIYAPHPKPYNEVMRRDRKRSKKTDQNNEEDTLDHLSIFENPHRRRTKKDALAEEELMNTASEKIVGLTAQISQLEDRLDQALIENTRLQLALEQERQVSSERESSNKTLRLMLLEERLKQAESRVHERPPSYQGLSMNNPNLHPPDSSERHSSNETMRLMLLEERSSQANPRLHDIPPAYQSLSSIHASLPPPPLPHLPIRPPDMGQHDQRFLATTVILVSGQRPSLRESMNRQETSNQQFSSQLTAQRIRSELASIVVRNWAS